MRYIEELEKSVNQNALKTENAKLNYRINHLLKYVEEIEASKK